MRRASVFADDASHADPPPVRSRAWRVIGWMAVVLSALMVAGCLFAYGAYLRLQGNINHDDVNALIGTANRPKKLNSALNILLMGSDGRNGANAKYGKADGARSDTLILLHISPGGGQTVGLSFPRDLMVPIPSCKGHPAQAVNMVNSAFSEGGPVCSLKTIEQLTHIRIDHFADIDFTGFKAVVDALGGVEVCLPQNVADKDSKLYLSKGYHLVKGEQALAYVRNRHGLGDGSDLDRVKRQQQFLSSVAKKALSAGTLSNPAKLWPLLNAATKSLTTDTGFDTSAMLKLASSLHGLTAGKIKFATVPYGAYPADPNRVALAQPAADNLFTALRNDTAPPTETKPAAAPKVPSNQVKVRVFNTTDVPGKALRIADQLTALGYHLAKVGNASAGPSRITYGPNAGPQAATVAAAIPGLTPKADSATPAGVVDVYVGTTFPSIKEARKPALPTTIQGQIKADGNLCKY
jgi:LCP family protein required for cell wall assembly